MLIDVYNILLSKYGPQGWWPGAGPLDVVIGAILTQNTAWSNVEKAIDSLKIANLWSLESIHCSTEEELASVVRSSGYFNQKARKLKSFAEHIYMRYEWDVAKFLNQELTCLRKELLSIYGIGPETADDILVYAAEKPSFIIDVYTKRILGRLGIIDFKHRARYEDYQKLIQDQLPQDVRLFNEFHALLDNHAKLICKKSPICSECVLIDGCNWAQQQDLVYE